LIVSAMTGAGIVEPTADDEPAGASLEVQLINKWFGATHALRDVSLSVAPGTVHAIVGENGAGKSTLVRIVAGAISAGSFEGRMLVDGDSVEFDGIGAAERAGIFLVPQELTTVGGMTVAENLMLNREPTRYGVIDYTKMFTVTADWIRTFRIGVEPTALMQSLSVPQQQLVTIAHAMMQGVKILILDEPTATLSELETAMLFARVRDFRKLGLTTLYISHRLAEITQIADRVTVMRDGRVVDDLDVHDAATTPRRIVRSMVGRDITELYPRTENPIGSVVFELQGLTVPHPVPSRRPYVEGVDLTVNAGEIVGLFGVIGSGTAQLARAAFGGWPEQVTGRILVNGRTVEMTSPRAAIAAGVGYLTGDRKASGLVMGMSVVENISLVALRQLSPHQVINVAEELVLATNYVQRFRIKVSSVDQECAELSGGTQQKVVASKWLAAAPDVFLLEEPTFGVDVGTKVEVYTMMGEIVREGRGILLISSDLQEVLAMSDRVVVLSNGRVAGSWKRGVATEEILMQAATGGEADE
jgi:ABC-type sugar transport system ATPase subunit